MAASKKIHVNASSLIELKAELYRKQEALKAEKLRRELGDFSKPSTVGRNEKAHSEKKQNAGVQERAKKDEQQHVFEEDTDLLLKSREMLEKKSRIYNTLTKGKVLPGDDIKEIYLVDFERKALQNSKEQCAPECAEEDAKEVPPPSCLDEEWVDYVDALGRSRRCMRKDLPDLQKMDKELRDCQNSASEDSENQANELPRSEDSLEPGKLAEASVGPVHYQTVRHNEIRTHGVGYFSFSTDEEQRKAQIESLKNLRDQTVEQRAARQRLKEKRKATLKVRLAKVKQRKGIEIESEDSEESASDKDVEVKKEETAAEEATKKETKVRPWDVGKILPPIHRKQQFTQQEWIQKRREERLQEFAPPQLYNLDSATFNDRLHSPRDCISDHQNTINMTTQEDIEKIIADTLTYYKNKS